MYTPHKQLTRFCSQRAYLPSNCLPASCRGAVSGPRLLTPPALRQPQPSLPLPYLHTTQRYDRQPTHQPTRPSGHACGYHARAMRGPCTKNKGRNLKNLCMPPSCRGDAAERCTPLKQLLRFCSQCAHLTSNGQGFAPNVHTSQATVKVLLSMCTPRKQLSRFCKCAHLLSNCQGFAFNVHTS